MAFSGCGMKNTVQIGTGDVNGTYYAYGTELAEILNNNSDVYFKSTKNSRFGGEFTFNISRIC